MKRERSKSRSAGRKRGQGGEENKQEADKDRQGEPGTTRKQSLARKKELGFEKGKEKDIRSESEGSNASNLYTNAKCLPRTIGNQRLQVWETKQRH